VSTQRLGWLKRKAPLLIFVAIALSFCGYVLFVLLTDTLIKGVPITNAPIVITIISFTHDVTQTISSLGYGGLFGLMLLEASSLPIPSEIILPFAGYLVSIDKLNFWITVVVATAAAIVGSLIDYFIGLKGIEALTKYRILGRCIFSESQIKVVASWFSKYGVAMVFLGRMIPLFRTLISFPAGAVRMPIPKFLVYTASGCLIWNSVLVYIGYYLGIKWQDVADFSHYIIIAAIAVLIGAVAFYFIRRNRRRKERSDSDCLL
jgi:membrane protein DedA with SNARE-associated domain